MNRKRTFYFFYKTNGVNNPKIIVITIIQDKEFAVCKLRTRVLQRVKKGQF